MKKNLLFLALFGLILASCQKGTLKQTSIAIDISNTTIETAPNENGFYLNHYTGYESELIDTYRKNLSDQLGKGKFTIVGPGEQADFTLTVLNLRYEERIKTVVRKRDEFEISAIGVSANMMLTATRTDVPQPFNVYLETEDCLTNDSDDGCERNGYHIHPTSVNDLEIESGKEARKKIKKMVKAHQ